MRVIREDVIRTMLYRVWINTKPTLREQEVIRAVLGIEIDPAYGKLVEKKEGGGIKLLPIPLQAQHPALVKTVADTMREQGWEIETSPLPRSTLSIATLRNESKGIMLKTSAMPADDAILFGAYAAKKIGDLSDGEITGMAQAI